MNNFEIKVSGSGTPEEIAQALIQLATSIRYDATHPKEELDGKEYEDKTLCATVKEIEGEKEELIQLWLDAEEELRNENEDKALKMKEEFSVRYDILSAEDKEYVEDYLDSCGAS